MGQTVRNQTLINSSPWFGSPGSTVELFGYLLHIFVMKISFHYGVLGVTIIEMQWHLLPNNAMVLSGHCLPLTQRQYKCTKNSSESDVLMIALAH